MSIDKTPRAVETFRMVPDRMTFDDRLRSHLVSSDPAQVLAFVAHGLLSWSKKLRSTTNPAWWCLVLSLTFSSSE